MRSIAPLLPYASSAAVVTSGCHVFARLPSGQSALQYLWGGLPPPPRHPTSGTHCFRRRRRTTSTARWTSTTSLPPWATWSWRRFACRQRLGVGMFPGRHQIRVLRKGSLSTPWCVGLFVGALSRVSLSLQSPERHVRDAAACRGRREGSSVVHARPRPQASAAWRGLLDRVFVYPPSVMPRWDAFFKPRFFSTSCGGCELVSSKVRSGAPGDGPNSNGCPKSVIGTASFLFCGGRCNLCRELRFACSFPRGKLTQIS